MEKLTLGQKHLLILIGRDAAADGWASVSELLCNVIKNISPEELVTFVKLNIGGRVRLTEEGKSVLNAMKWL